MCLGLVKGIGIVGWVSFSRSVKSWFINGVCVALVWREFSVGAICRLGLVCGLARSLPGFLACWLAGLLACLACLPACLACLLACWLHCEKMIGEKIRGEGEKMRLSIVL